MSAYRAPFTHPDLASLVDPPFAAHKEGKNYFYLTSPSSGEFRWAYMATHFPKGILLITHTSNNDEQNTSSAVSGMLTNGVQSL